MYSFENKTSFILHMYLARWWGRWSLFLFTTDSEESVTTVNFSDIMTRESDHERQEISGWERVSVVFFRIEVSLATHTHTHTHMPASTHTHTHTHMNIIWTWHTPSYTHEHDTLCHTNTCHMHVHAHTHIIKWYVSKKNKEESIKNSSEGFKPFFSNCPWLFDVIFRPYA